MNYQVYLKEINRLIRRLPMYLYKDIMELVNQNPLLVMELGSPMQAASTLLNNQLKNAGSDSMEWAMERIGCLVRVCWLLISWSDLHAIQKKELHQALLRFLAKTGIILLVCALPVSWVIARMLMMVSYRYWTSIHGIFTFILVFLVLFLIIRRCLFLLRRHIASSVLEIIRPLQPGFIAETLHEISLQEKHVL